MSTVRSIIFIQVLLFSLAAQARDEDKGLILLAEEKAPHIMYDEKNGEFSGREIDIVATLMKDSGVDYSLVLTPRRRALRRINNEKNVCILAINHTPEREESFEWVSPTQIGGWAIFQRPDDDITLSSLKDVTSHRIVGRLGTQSTEELEAIIGKPIYKAADISAAVRMLYGKRADLLVSGVNDAKDVAQRLGVPSLKKAFDWKPAFFGLACSLTTDALTLERLRGANEQRLAGLR